MYGRLRPDYSFKPRLHRCAVQMAQSACHVASYALQFSITRVFRHRHGGYRMQSSEKSNTSFDRASRRLPTFMIAGLLSGLSLGVVAGNISYGVAGGVLVSILAWFVVAGRRTSQQAPDIDADA